MTDILKHSVSVPAGGHSEGRVTLIGGICGQILTQRNSLFQRAGSAGDCITCEQKANKTYIDKISFERQSLFGFIYLINLTERFTMKCECFVHLFST